MSPSSRPGVRFQTRRSWPASTSRRAIGAPIAPKPRNATRGMPPPPPRRSGPPSPGVYRDPSGGVRTISCVPSMRITGVSTWVVDAGDRDWVFLRVETDEPGLAGWGEASLGWQTRAVLGAVRDLE